MADEADPKAEFDPAVTPVQTVARIERDALVDRSVGERISDRITKVAGSIPFLVFHILLFFVWAVINSGKLPGISIFDPFPYGILTLFVSAEGVFLAIFILISQNRMSRQADKRSQLSLQFNMIAEHEMTAMLRMQRQVCQHLGIRVEDTIPEAIKMMQRIDVDALLAHLDEELPDH
jgi:uncharacterized membrane protein